MKTCNIKNEYYSLTVSTLGAELVSLKSADGYEYIWQNEGEKFWRSHAPLLFPVCGRLKNQKYTYREKEYLMGLHGFLRDMDFAVASKEGGHITMTFSSNDESKKAYPFSFVAIANYELRADELIFSFTLTNTGSEEMPYMFGWHPGFNLPTNDKVDINDFKMEFENTVSLKRHGIQNGAFVCPDATEYKIPDGAYHLNEAEIYESDTMIFTSHNNALKLYADTLPYLLEMSWSENLPYLCIWKSPASDAKFICIEPWSDIPNDGAHEENFDTRKMSRLKAKESETFTYTLKIKH